MKSLKAGIISAVDTYKYISSKGVREYNEKIGHKFNAIESAFLVWPNRDISLEESHDAHKRAS